MKIHQWLYFQFSFTYRRYPLSTQMIPTLGAGWGLVTGDIHKRTPGIYALPPTSAGVRLDRLRKNMKQDRLFCYKQRNYVRYHNLPQENHRYKPFYKNVWHWVLCSLQRRPSSGAERSRPLGWTQVPTGSMGGNRTHTHTLTATTITLWLKRLTCGMIAHRGRYDRHRLCSVSLLQQRSTITMTSNTWLHPLQCDHAGCTVSWILWGTVNI